MTRGPQAANAFAASKVLATGYKRLFSVTAYNSSAGTLYLQIFDAAVLPANATVPLMEVAIPTKSTGSLDFGTNGCPFTTGIVAAFSSTDASLTVDVSADGLFLGVTS